MKLILSPQIAPNLIPNGAMIMIGEVMDVGSPSRFDCHRIRDPSAIRERVDPVGTC